MKLICAVLFFFTTLVCIPLMPVIAIAAWALRSPAPRGGEL